MKDTLDKFAAATVVKLQAAGASGFRYFVSSMQAGLYVGIGVITILSVGAPLQAAGSPLVKLVMAASFGVALTLVIFAGSELFTGNNMIMAIGCFRRQCRWGSVLKAWGLCYAGNFAGSLALAGMMALTGLAARGPLHDFITAAAGAKMAAPFWELFFRGVLCNMLVCLAIWTSSRTASDTAKLGLIFWCLFAFIACGFEHSIANMTLLGLSLMVSAGEAGITWAGFAANMVPVTLGNVAGGVVFVAGAYAYVASAPKKAAVAEPAKRAEPAGQRVAVVAVETAAAE